jgi:hypothetical protein
MTSSIDNLTAIAADLNAAGKTVKVTVLPTRKAKKSELVFSMTKGPRTNTNRRGQAYAGHATSSRDLKTSTVWRATVPPTSRPAVEPVWGVDPPLYPLPYRV